MNKKLQRPILIVVLVRYLWRELNCVKTPQINPPIVLTFTRQGWNSTTFHLPSSCAHQIHSSHGFAVFIHLATKLYITCHMVLCFTPCNCILDYDGPSCPVSYMVLNRPRIHPVQQYPESSVELVARAGILKSLCGLGTEEEQGYRTAPPGYIGCRNSFLGIDSWAP